MQKERERERETSSRTDNFYFGPGGKLGLGCLTRVRHSGGV